MKNEFGACTSRLSLCEAAVLSADGCRRSVDKLVEWKKKKKKEKRRERLVNKPRNTHGSEVVYKEPDTTRLDVCTGCVSSSVL